MSSVMKTVGELRSHLIDRATADEEFRARLLSDPKAAVEEELGLTIPAGFNIVVHENVAADTTHLVLPPSAKLGEADLQQAAGGTPPHLRGKREGESDWDAICRTLFR